MKLRYPLSTLVLSTLLLGCASHPTAKGGTGPSGWWKPGITDPQLIVQAMAKCRVVAAGASQGTWRPKNVLTAAAMDKHRQGGVAFDCLIAEGFQYTRQSAVPAGLAFVPEE
jgi:hypothetical protein